MRPFHRLLPLALSAASLAGADMPAASAPLPPHPRLLLDARGVAQLRQRIAQPVWSNQWAAFQRDFDKTLDKPVDLPPRGGNWWHWYVCPQHGGTLTQGRKIAPWQWEHVCPVDHQVFHGDPQLPAHDYDGCVLALTHASYSRAIRDAGILYAVTGDARYLRRGRDILLAYAGRYQSYPLHNVNGAQAVGGGRIGAQTLDESTWLIPAAQGADLLWPALAETDRQTLTSQLFLPAVNGVILPHKMGVHNIQCWMNSAIGLAGLLLGDDALIHAAVDDPQTGYRTQMAEGVLRDGAWREGAWGYHFYTLSAVLPLAEAARNCGFDLYGEPLRRLLAAPLTLAMPNLKLPAFNDSREVGIPTSLYELGYARYRDPLFLKALAGHPRTNEFGLWYGVDALPAAAESQPAPSRNDDAGGYAMLQQGPGEQATWLCLKYGPHGGGHGHPDKLTFVLCAHGLTVCPDAGTRGYGSPLHADWDKTTLAHSTLIAGQANQAAACGRSLAFGSAGGADYAMADAGPVYPGLRFVRTVLLLRTNLLVFIDQVEADRPQLLDLACHITGAWQNLPAGAAFTPPDKPGYRHLEGATTRPAGEGTVLMVGVTNNLRVAMTLAANAPTEIVTATGIGRDTADRVPVVLFRRQARQTTYAWSLALDGAAVRLAVDPDSTPRLTRVRIATAQGLWQVAADSDACRVLVTPLPPPDSRSR